MKDNILTLILSVTDVLELLTFLPHTAKGQLKIYGKLEKFLANPETTGKKIPLLSGGYTLVSKKDFEYLAETIWDRNEIGYIFCIRGPLRGCLMYKVVGKRTGLDPRRALKHIDGDKLNNQQENLCYA